MRDPIEASRIAGVGGVPFDPLEGHPLADFIRRYAQTHKLNPQFVQSIVDTGKPPPVTGAMPSGLEAPDFTQQASVQDPLAELTPEGLIASQDDVPNVEVQEHIDMITRELMTPETKPLPKQWDSFPDVENRLATSDYDDIDLDVSRHRQAKTIEDAEIPPSEEAPDTDPGILKGGVWGGIALGWAELADLVVSVSDWAGMPLADVANDWLDEKLLPEMYRDREEFLRHGGPGRRVLRWIGEYGLYTAAAGATAGIIKAGGHAAVKAMNKTVRKTAGRMSDEVTAGIRASLTKAEREIATSRERVDDYAGRVFSEGQGPVNKSLGQRVTEAKNWVLDNFADKYSSIYATSSKEVNKENFKMVQRLRNMTGIVSAPFTLGTYKLGKGGVMNRTGESFHDIWAGIKPEFRRDVETFVTARREAYAFKHMPDVKVEKGEYEKAIETLADLKDIYGTEGYKQIKEIALRHSRWRNRSILDPLHDAGIISDNLYRKWMDPNYTYVQKRKVIDPKTGRKKIKEFTVKGAAMEKLYSPLFRKSSGATAVDEFLTDSFLAELVEQTGTVADDLRALLKKNFNEVTPEHIRLKKASKYVAPHKKLTRGAQYGNVVDVLDGDIARVLQITKLAEKQTARNAIGRTIEKVPDWKGRYLRVSEDMNPGEFIRGLSEADTFVTFENGRRSMYKVSDPRIIQAVNSISGSQANFFERFVESPFFRVLSGPTRLFRKGIVLGPDFMVRNATRDQFTAIAMSRFGYTPLDFVRGMAHAIGKTEQYKAFKAWGADSTIQQMNRIRGGEFVVDELTSPLTFGERISRRARELQKMEPQDSEGLLPVLNRAYRAFRDIEWGKRGTPTLGQSLRESFKSSTQAARLSGAREHRVLTSLPLGKTIYYPFHAMSRISETLEEATRFGAANRIAMAAKKGKGYTRLASLDFAMGGLRGYANKLGRMLSGDADAFKGVGEAYSKFRNTPIKGIGDYLDEAREITVDFQRKGYIGEVLNGIIPFSNVDFQDLSRINRAIRENPLSFMLRSFAAITVPAMLNWLKWRDDPDYHSNYKEIEKHLFLHPVDFNDEQVHGFRIPRPVGAASMIFGRGPEMFMDWLAATDPSAIVDIEGFFFPMTSQEREMRKAEYKLVHRSNTDVIARLKKGFEEATPFRWLQPNILQHTYPLGPLLNIEANYDPHMERPIVPPSMTGMRAPLPEDVRGLTSGPIEVMIAGALKSIDEWMLPGKFFEETNPLQVKHLISKYGATPGRIGLYYGNLALQKTGVADEIPEVARSAWRENVFSRGFFQGSPYGGGSRSVAEFYEAFTEVSKQAESMRIREEKMDIDGIKKLLSAEPYVEEKKKIVMDGAKSLGQLWDEWRRIRTDKSLDPQERLDQLHQLDQLISMVAIYYLDSYRMINSLSAQYRRDRYAE